MDVIVTIKNVQLPESVKQQLAAAAGVDPKAFDWWTLIEKFAPILLQWFANWLSKQPKPGPGPQPNGPVCP